MIFNKILNITDEDVANQDNIEVLNQWRNSLNSQLTTLLAGVDSWHDLPRNKKVAYKYLFSLLKMVKHRINAFCFEKKQNAGWVSERNKRKDRSLSMVFMRIAKRELRKEEYLRILEIAQSEGKLEEEAHSILLEMDTRSEME